MLKAMRKYGISSKLSRNSVNEYLYKPYIYGIENLTVCTNGTVGRRQVALEEALIDQLLEGDENE